MSTDFLNFDLHPQIVQSIHDLGYESPTPIQAEAIPVLMQGRDVLGQAQTGTGKTAAFALPMLNALEPEKGGVQGFIVAPTRELALQTAKAVYQYGKHLDVRVLPIYGGQPYGRQISRLRRGVDVVVGTPGRLLDLIRKGALDLSMVRYLVLDEADEMLSMGFLEDIEAILKETPDARQTALFSATLPKSIRRLADQYMSEPESVIVNTQRMTVAQTEQRYYLVNGKDKFAALTRLLEVEPVTRALVFTRTKVGAGELADALFARGIHAGALHGDMSQSAREMVVGRFRRGDVTVLVATDVAARGLDIDDISHVFNYDIPYDPESYVHRIGRTGRAGKEGKALMLVTPGQKRRLQQIESYTMQSIVRAKLPSEADVLAHRDAEFLAKLSHEFVAGLGEPRAMVEQLCDAGYDPLDVAAAAIRLARAEERERPIESVHELRERKKSSRKRGKKRSREGGESRHKRGREAGMVRLSISLGRSQGLRPRDVVGAIAGETGISSKAIGAIDIQAQHTLVDVEEQHVGKVLAKMKNCRMRGKPATLGRVDS